MTSSNQKIANPESAAGSMEKGPELNDRDRLNDILATEKYLTDSFNVAVREASHDQLFQDVLQVLQETHQAGRDIYNLMFQKGWYTLEAEQQTQIDQTRQQFQAYSSQFPYPSTLQ